MRAKQFLKEYRKDAANFTVDDIKALEGISDLRTLKDRAFALISNPSQRPMKPEKVQWFKNRLEDLKSPTAVIKLMYDLLLSGEGHGVIGSRYSTNPNSYRSRFNESAGDGDVANAVVAEVIKLIGEGHTEVSPDVITTKVSAALGRPFMLKDLVAANNSSPELQHYIASINPSKIKFSTDILTVKNEDPIKEKQAAQDGVAKMASRAASRPRLGEGQDFSKDKITKFHKKLDNLVHNTFGKREDEIEEESSSIKGPHGYMDVERKNGVTTVKRRDWDSSSEKRTNVKGGTWFPKSNRHGEGEGTSVKTGSGVGSNFGTRRKSPAIEPDDYTEREDDIYENYRNYYGQDRVNLPDEPSLYWSNTGRLSNEYNELYNKLVPSSGKADTVEGEVLRAASKIYYRHYNDGDSFNQASFDQLEPYIGTVKSYDDLAEKATEFAIKANGQYTPNPDWDSLDAMEYGPEDEGDDWDDEEDYDDDTSWEDDDDLAEDSKPKATPAKTSGINWPKEVPSDRELERAANRDEEENDPHPWVNPDELREGDMTNRYRGFKIHNRVTNQEKVYPYIKGKDSRDVEDAAIREQMKLTGQKRADFSISGLVKINEEYEDDYEEEDQGFFVAISDEEDGVFIGMLVKEDGKWRERTYKGNAPYNWGGTYMGYLTPQDVMTWINKDYGRSYEVQGPMDEDEANEYLDYMSEGIGKTIKRAVKNVKRGLQGWDKSGGIEPKEIVKRNKGYDDATVKNLRTALKGDGKKTSSSPGDLQQRVLDREAKKRGLDESNLNEMHTHYDQVKYNGKLLTLDRWPDGHLTISVGNKVLKSGPFAQIKSVWDKLKGEQVTESDKKEFKSTYKKFNDKVKTQKEKKQANEGWESGPEERAPRERDPDWEYDQRRQEKLDAEADKQPKKTTYKLNGRGPNQEPNWDFGLGEFDTQEEAIAARERLMADPKTPNPRDIGIQTIRRSVAEGVDIIRKLAGLK